MSIRALTDKEFKTTQELGDFISVYKLYAPSSFHKSLLYFRKWLILSIALHSTANKASTGSNMAISIPGLNGIQQGYQHRVYFKDVKIYN